MPSIFAQAVLAWWQSGYAEDCKSLYAGSIPTQASKILNARDYGRFCYLCFIFNGCIIWHMIKTITLTNFRNHAMCRINTHGRHNIIITGPNGAGKTAVLEAVSMLSGDRGLRGAPMSDIARFGCDGGFSVLQIWTMKQKYHCHTPQATQTGAHGLMAILQRWGIYRHLYVWYG